MLKPKLIVLNGFAASGKTTIAKKYIANHSLALAYEADALVDNMGDWIHHEHEVRQLTFAMAQAILRIHLAAGHDVILPYMVTSAEEFETFESIAREYTADYYECLLHNNRDDAIERLFKRGTWGEATSPPLTQNDMPNINRLLNKMDEALKNRAHTIKIEIKGQSPDDTYAQIVRLTNA